MLTPPDKQDVLRWKKQQVFAWDVDAYDATVRGEVPLDDALGKAMSEIAVQHISVWSYDHMTPVDAAMCLVDGITDKFGPEIAFTVCELLVDRFDGPEPVCEEEEEVSHSSVEYGEALLRAFCNHEDEWLSGSELRQESNGPIESGTSEYRKWLAALQGLVEEGIIETEGEKGARRYRSKNRRDAE